MMHPHQKTTRFVLWCLTAPVLLYAACEILVRLFIPAIGPQGTDRILYAGNRYGASHGLKPNSSGRSNGAIVRVDENGFRKTSVKSKASKSGWLLLGDSVTLGIGVEEDRTFAGILQSGFPRVNIFNPSMIGYNVEDYGRVFHHFIEDRGNDLKINRVLLFWCLNDLYSDHDAVELPGGQIRVRFGKGLNLLRSHSRFYFYLKTLLFDRPRSYFLFDLRRYESTPAQVTDAVGKVVEIRQACARKGIRFTVILLPNEYQLRSGGNASNMPQRVLTAEMEKRGIQMLNPLDYLKDSGVNSRDLYLYGDGIHLSAKGHEKMADFLFSRLNTD
jgi:hypothetical protein